MERSTPQEIFPVRLVHVLKLFLFALVIYSMLNQSRVS